MVSFVGTKSMPAMRIISVLLALVLVIGGFAFQVKAATPTVSDNWWWYKQLSTNERLMYDELYARFITDPNGHTYTNMVYSGTFTHGDYTTAALLQISMERAFAAFIYDNPLAFWLNGAVGVSCGDNGLVYSTITFTVAPDSNLIAQKGAIYAAIDSIAANASAGADDYTKIKTAHDEIATIVDYDYTTAAAPIGAGDPDSFAISGPMVGAGNLAVCEGYAKAFKAVMDELGIPTVLVFGNLNVAGTAAAGGHMWNAVKLNGSWYVVDVTNDDQNPTINDLFLIGKTDAIPLMSNQNYTSAFTEIIGSASMTGMTFPNIANSKYIAPVVGTTMTMNVAPTVSRNAVVGETASNLVISGGQFVDSTTNAPVTINSLTWANPAQAFTTVGTTSVAFKATAVGYADFTGNINVTVDAPTPGTPVLVNVLNPTVTGNVVLGQSAGTLTLTGGQFTDSITNAPVSVTYKWVNPNQILVAGVNYIPYTASATGYPDFAGNIALYVSDPNAIGSYDDGGGSSGRTTGSSFVDGSLTTNSTAKVNATITQKDAEKALEVAITKLPSGQKTVTLTFANGYSINKEVLNSLQKIATQKGLMLTINFDDVVGKKVVARMTFSNVKQAAENFKLGFNQDRAKKVADIFRKYCKNNLTAVSTNQQGALGQTVTIAVPLPSNMNAKNIVVYRYDSTTNTYSIVKNANPYVDSVGYVHFQTTSGGDFVISNGELQK